MDQRRDQPYTIGSDMTNIDCEKLIDQLHSEARHQLELALIAKNTAVAGMHLDLAEFSETQAQIAAEICVEL